MPPPCAGHHRHRSRSVSRCGEGCQPPPNAPLEREPATTSSEHFKRGERHFARGDFEQAAAEFELAFAADGSLVWALINAGLARARLQRYDESLQTLARAISIAPRNPQAINAVGTVFLAQGRNTEALAAFDAALAEDATLSLFHYNRALALHGAGESAEATRAYRRAIAIGPDDAPMHVGLGTVLTELGDFDAAAKSFRTALQRDPTNFQALQRWFDLGTVAADDPHLPTLQSLAARVDTLPMDRQIELHFVLAKVASDLGDNAEAFDQFLVGNTKKRSTIDYQEAQELALLSAIRETFTTDLLREKSGSGNRSEAPIFIVGMPRSGTTLVEQMLASHSAIAAGGERSDVRRVVNDANVQLQRDFPQWVPGIPDVAFAELGASYLKRLGALATTSRRFTDKMPANVLHAGFIHLMFPRARIIHVRRDALDTCISCFTCLFSEEQNFSYDLEELGRYYRAYDRLAAHWRDVLPSNAYLEVSYEAVVDDVEGQARRILAHLQLEWDPRVLEFYNTSRSVRTASVQQVRKPIYTSSVGRSAKYGNRLLPLRRALELPE